MAELMTRDEPVLAKGIGTSLVIALVVTSCAGSREPIVVRGELSWQGAGLTTVSECTTGRTFEIGVMASAPYFQLVRRAEELSAGGAKPILVEVRGVLATSSATGAAGVAHIDNPRFVEVVQSECACAIPPEFADLPRRNPKAEARAALQLGEVQLLAVAGFVIEVPGISGRSACWLNADLARVIPGTTDAVCPGPHEEFQEHARAFARSFNRELFKRAPDLQRHECAS